MPGDEHADPWSSRAGRGFALPAPSRQAAGMPGDQHADPWSSRAGRGFALPAPETVGPWSAKAATSSHAIARLRANSDRDPTVCTARARSASGEQQASRGVVTLHVDALAASARPRRAGEQTCAVHERRELWNGRGALSRHDRGAGLRHVPWRKCGAGQGAAQAAAAE